MRQNRRSAVKFCNFNTVLHSVEFTEFYCHMPCHSQINDLLNNFTLSWFDEKNLRGSKISRFSTTQLLCTYAFLLKKLLKNWFHEKYFQWGRISLSSQKYISWNQFFSNFVRKNVTFTKFLPKICEFSVILFTIFGKNCVKSTVINNYFMMFSRNFFLKYSSGGSRGCGHISKTYFC